MGYFVVNEKKNLDELKLGDRINESDYATLTPSGNFVQLKYIEETDDKQYEVTPGLWCISKNSSGMFLETTKFVEDKLLDGYVNAQPLIDIADCFFNNISIYYEEGIEVPKRGVLAYGPAGTGKTSAINRVGRRYSEDKKTAVVVWQTDKFDPIDVKRFVKQFNYNGVERMILIAEDLGGTEAEHARSRSDSTLLSLLDNQEKTFKIPVLIVATTNYPALFLGNLTNRPGRFDDKIEIGYPGGDARRDLYLFFNKEATESELSLIKSDKCKKLTPAHIKDIRIRSRIFNKPREKVINEILDEINLFEKDFTKQKSLGFNG